MIDRRPGFLRSCREEFDQESINRQEEQAGAGEPVKVLDPGGGGIRTAVDAVDHRCQKAGVAEKVDPVPGFLADPLTDVKAQIDDPPDVKSQLADSDPRRAVILARKWDQYLDHVVMYVMIAGQDHSVKQR